MKKLKMTKRMMALGIASIGLIGTTVVVAPLLTDCSKKITELTLSKTTFSLSDFENLDPWVVKGFNDKWLYLYLFNAEKPIKTLDDYNKANGYKDDNIEVPPTACIKGIGGANSRDNKGSRFIRFEFDYGGVTASEGEYTLYGVAFRYEQYIQFCNNVPVDYPNYNKDAKIPGTLVSCKITLVV